MNKKIALTLTFLLAFGATSPVYALFGSGHGSEHQSSGAGHGSSAGHGSDASHDNLAALGEKTVDGVKAAAHLGDVRDAMAQAGQPMTHHLQILFTDLATGKTVETGSVAVKVTTPKGEALPAQALLGMDGHFGIDLTLSTPGTYEFALGTKLADGKKRQFEFSAVVK